MQMISLPSNPAIGRFFSTLLFRDATVVDTPAIALRDSTPCTAGVYRSLNGGLNGLCVMDLRLSAITAAALGGYPLVRAEESVAEGKLEPTLAEIAPEVFNVGSRLFEAPGVSALLLQGIHFCPPVPAEVLQGAARSSHAKTVLVALHGYTQGKMSIYVKG